MHRRTIRLICWLLAGLFIFGTVAAVLVAMFGA